MYTAMHDAPIDLRFVLRLLASAAAAAAAAAVDACPMVYVSIEIFFLHPYCCRLNWDSFVSIDLFICILAS
jgi:hypothetical protein